mmetsp:Transcript_51301/g.164947  ORF Transcript_51301/g.164947 Transcript_51301/m.164947 type:complete len:207 (-) Transcript_51301:141-761(-)
MRPHSNETSVPPGFSQKRVGLRGTVAAVDHWQGEATAGIAREAEPKGRVRARGRVVDVEQVDAQADRMTGGHLDAESVHAHRELGARARPAAIQACDAGHPDVAHARREQLGAVPVLLDVKQHCVDLETRQALWRVARGVGGAPGARREHGQARVRQPADGGAALERWRAVDGRRRPVHLVEEGAGLDAAGGLEHRAEDWHPGVDA